MRHDILQLKEAGIVWNLWWVKQLPTMRDARASPVLQHLNSSTLSMGATTGPIIGGSISCINSIPKYIPANYHLFRNSSILYWKVVSRELRCASGCSLRLFLDCTGTQAAWTLGEVEAVGFLVGSKRV